MGRTVLGKKKSVPICMCVFPLKDRPPPNSWKKIEHSREYKNGNQLREYQLEGLNWLLFNWYNRYIHRSFLMQILNMGVNKCYRVDYCFD